MIKHILRPFVVCIALLVQGVLPEERGESLSTLLSDELTRAAEVDLAAVADIHESMCAPDLLVRWWQ